MGGGGPCPERLPAHPQYNVDPMGHTIPRCMGGNSPCGAEEDKPYCPPCIPGTRPPPPNYNSRPSLGDDICCMAEHQPPYEPGSCTTYPERLRRGTDTCVGDRPPAYQMANYLAHTDNLYSEFEVCGRTNTGNAPMDFPSTEFHRKFGSDGLNIASDSRELQDTMGYCGMDSCLINDEADETYNNKRPSTYVKVPGVTMGKLVKLVLILSFVRNMNGNYKYTSDRPVGN